MKKLILFITLSISTSSLFSQSPASVTVVSSAPTLETIEKAQLTKTIETLNEATEQTSNMKKSVKLLDRSMEILEEVNDHLTSSQHVLNILSKQLRVIQNIDATQKRIANMKYVNSNELISLNRNVISLLRSTNQLGELINELLTSGFYNMDDGQRLTMIDDTGEQLDAIASKMMALERKYRKINDNRAFYASF